MSCKVWNLRARSDKLFLGSEQWTGLSDNNNYYISVAGSELLVEPYPSYKGLDIYNIK